jgi:hypothetical protein
MAVTREGKTPKKVYVKRRENSKADKKRENSKVVDKKRENSKICQDKGRKNSEVWENSKLTRRGKTPKYWGGKTSRNSQVSKVLQRGKRRSVLCCVFLS